MKNWKLTGFIATLIIVLAIPIYMLSFYLKDNANSVNEKTEFIGREKCRDCHKKEYDSWLGSHHDKAMDIANDTTVMGDFNNAEFEYDGIKSRFYKKDGKFWVYTNGPGGKMGDFEITHTFGYTPLQQYLIPFEKGRYQCLPIAWNTEKGKWFSLVEAAYPDQSPAPSDWLYWTNNGQNWNGMCAECHSTNLQKNYDPVTKTFNTTYSEIDVSCEACHGPGSKHEEWAQLPEMARPVNTNFNLAVKTSGITNKEYVDLCVYCHSRRSSLDKLTYDNRHAMDIVIPRVLDENYFPDGQILEEDYVYGSFIQSKMFDSDIQCNDCHDVHSGKRLFENNELCTQCHKTEIYNTYDHHFHKKKGEKGNPIKLKDKTYEVGEGALCANCHMPAKYYMGNDLRNDHSLRVPRPDLTMSIGVPNACNQCHEDKSAKWADEYVTKWYGVKRKAHTGTTFAAARNADPKVLKDLIRIIKDGLYLPIVRATAISLLQNYNNNESLEAVKWAMKADEPIIRYNSVQVFNSADADELKKYLVPLLSDPVRSIRMEAGFKLSVLPKGNLATDKNKLLNDVINEYMTAMNYSADFAGSRFNLGILYANLQDFKKSISNYYEAIEIDSLFYPAKVNLAVVLNKAGKNDEAETILRDLIMTHPEIHDSYYSLGLLLAERQKYDEAIVYLEKASELLPERPRILYNLALILQFQKKDEAAELNLIKAIKISPDNFDFLYALADHYIKNNQFGKALKISNQIKIKFPSSQTGDQLLNYLSDK
ncbi:MAG: tetratricopeptide repeat protein [Melioribacteraceae bacterium]|nr:tetratricopeptide repeat protein [Melioribacteraceae bacterium]